MRGNLVQLTLGGYFYEMPGIIENITITKPNDTTWEIGIPPSEADSTQFAASPTRFTGDNVQELPHRLDVSMTFRPIHNFLPQIVKNINGGQNIKQRFLSLANGNPNLANANLYAGPTNAEGQHIGVPNQFKIKQPEAVIEAGDGFFTSPDGEFTGVPTDSQRDAIQNALNSGILRSTF
jgi:hypothetical protein